MHVYIYMVGVSSTLGKQYGIKYNRINNTPYCSFY
jgi:hypothetical protein